MAKRIAYFSGSFAASAAGSVTTANNYMGILPAVSTQLVDILEIDLTGMATSSTVCAGTFVPVSANSSGASALAAPMSDGPLNTSATALASVVKTYTTTGTTQPTPSAATTVPKISVGCNLFGGIARWNAAPTQQFTLVGTATSTGESVYYNSSTYNGATGNANFHIIYEPY